MGGLSGTVRQCGWASEQIGRSSGFNSGGGTEGDERLRNRVGGLKERGGGFSGGGELRDEGRQCGGLSSADIGEDERPVVRLWLTSRTPSTAQFITV